MRREMIRYMMLPLVLTALAAGCGDDRATAPEQNPGPTPAPDFSLADVNPTSATYNLAVSPRDHLQKVSAWYFGHAT